MKTEELESLVETQNGAQMALLDYRQCDEEGIFCQTSRQAVHEVSDMLEDLAREVLALRQRVEAAKKMADAVEGLIGESYGVAGLHRNGDLAPWDELCEGGRFEEWLLPLATFRATGGEG